MASTSHEPPTSCRDFEVGQEPVPGFRLIEHLGPDGETYKAEGPGGFRVALQWQRRKHLRKSLDLFKDIRHPHVLAIFGVWSADEVDIVAMELAECTLSDRLRQGSEKGIAPLELLQYMEDAAKGLDYLNAPRHTLLGKSGMSVVHGDIKPVHLRLVGGHVKVAEFIHAECVDPTQPDEERGHVLACTPAFAAPERVQGVVSVQADQYSLAASYYYLRTGRHLFSSASVREILRQCQEEDPDLAPLPVHERRVLLRALARKPKDRWPTCLAFVNALKKAMAADTRHWWQLWK